MTLGPSNARLLICGASARSAAWSATNAGFDVVALDLFADSDLCEIASVHRIPATRYPHGLPDLAKKIKTDQQIDGWLYTGGLENHPAVIEQVRALIPLYGNGRDALAIVRDPVRLMSIFADEGIPHPVTTERAVVSSTGLNVQDKRWLIKPRASAAGHGIRFVSPSNPISAIHSSNDGIRYVFQEFIDGPTYAAVFVADAEQVYLLGVTRLWTNRDIRREDSTVREPRFHYVGSTGPVDLSHNLVNQWIHIGKVVARRAALVGLFGVDAVVVGRGGEQTVYPIEVNPRYTASVEIIERALDCSPLRQHVDACRGLLENPFGSESAWQPKLRWGKRIRYARRSLVFDQECLSRLGTRPTGVSHWLVADTPTLNTKINQQAPILTTIAAGNSLSVVENALGFVGDRVPAAGDG